MIKPHELRSFFASRLIGQGHVIEDLVTPVTQYNAGFHWGVKPAGVYLLLGPSGTGKTLSTEIMAEALHGSPKLLRVNCGEYTMDHQIATLIGAPPGYLGHRETHPVFTQEKLIGLQSQECDLAVILFDEIEKASHSMEKLLLGVLDKGELRLGDNRTVSFTRTLIFFTSNLGTKEFGSKSFNFIKDTREDERVNVAHSAAKRHFAPEFLNRIDTVVTYNPLSADTVRTILRGLVAQTNGYLKSRVDGKGLLQIAVSPEAEDFIISRGYSEEYGARELARVWGSEVKNQLAQFVAACAGSTRQWPMLRVEARGKGLEFRPMTYTEALQESIHVITQSGPQGGIFEKKAGGWK
jgi:ATP-dependent Clp protease ATP-binding subunit ClpA